MSYQSEFIQTPTGTASPRPVGVGVGVLGRELMAPLAVGRSDIDPLSPLVPHILDVRFPSICAKVSRVSAGAAIDARVADLQPFGNLGVIGEHPRKDVGPFTSTIKRGSAVSLLVDISRPRMTGIRTTATVEPQQDPFTLAHARRACSWATKRVTPPNPALVVHAAPSPTNAGLATRDIVFNHGAGTLRHGSTPNSRSSGRRSLARVRRLRTFYRVEVA